MCKLKVVAAAGHMHGGKMHKMSEVPKAYIGQTLHPLPLLICLMGLLPDKQRCVNHAITGTEEAL